MPTISVIVPVYNVEKYLSKCLNSIIAQTFSDIEIICVNDGSTDNSRKILEQYKNRDSRIKIVDKKNGGLSSARNAGMAIATGEFYSFIDSDDWVEPTMLEKLYKNITALNTDISICGVNLVYETKDKQIDDEKYFNLEYFDKSFDGKVFSYKDVKPFLMNVGVMAWNKLYRRKLIDECNARFPEGLIFEDGPFFFSIFFKTKRVSLVRELLYFYRINRPSSILQKCGEQFENIIDVVNLMFNSLKESDIFDEVKYDFFFHKAEDIIYRYSLIPKKFKNRYRQKFRQTSCLLNKKYFDFVYISDKMKIKYKRLCNVGGIVNIIDFYYYKFIVELMYKIMQILYTEDNIYYFKCYFIKLRLKKRPNICNVWYENDIIYCILFNNIKFHFNFEYSKLEQLKYEKSDYISNSTRL
ncbi:glycosyltransferase [bacterium]|nr:glycosyltransferase [bacterium]